MEGLKEIARIYYERSASQAERDAALLSFTQIDANNDGRISFIEFKTFFNLNLADDYLFRNLDQNRDGTLDITEYLALYFAVEKVGMTLRCDSCKNYIFGPYFSCSACLSKGANSFEVCCACVDRGGFVHEHSFDKFIDQFSMLKLFRDQVAANPEIGQAKSYTDPNMDQILIPDIKREMADLYEIAKSRHRQASIEEQAMAHQFFQSLDTNRDRVVDQREFMNYTETQGYTRMSNPQFFRDLDKNGNGTLDFWEVLTFRFIIQSKRPFCECCGNLITRIFYSCLDCFKSHGPTFDLCAECYKSSDWKHSHNGPVQFLDHYSLLMSSRIQEQN